jgi:hypothetical protein
VVIDDAGTWYVFGGSEDGTDLYVNVGGTQVLVSGINAENVQNVVYVPADSTILIFSDQIYKWSISSQTVIATMGYPAGGDPNQPVSQFVGVDGLIMCNFCRIDPVALTVVNYGYITDYAMPWPGDQYQFYHHYDGASQTFYIMDNNDNVQWLGLDQIGPSEPRYPCDGWFDTTKTPGDVLTGLLSAGAGKISWLSAQWCLALGAWRDSTLDLGDDDLRGPVQAGGKVSRRDLYNGVKGVFVFPQNNWQTTDFPAMVRAGFVADDAGIEGTNDRGLWLNATAYAVNDAVMSAGYAYVCTVANTSSPATEPGVGGSWTSYWVYAGEILWKDVQYPFTQSQFTVQRLAKIDLEWGRRQITCSLPLKLRGYLAIPPDVISLTRASFGWTAKTFELQTCQLALSGDPPLLGVDITLHETDANVYAWSASDAIIMSLLDIVVTGGNTVFDTGGDTWIIHPLPD